MKKKFVKCMERIIICETWTRQEEVGSHGNLDMEKM